MIGAGTIKLKDDEFAELSDIIYKHSGITFSATKKYLLENRLSRRIQELNFNSFKDYIYYLKYDIKKMQEMITLLNLVTINETYFLRERPQMDYLVNKVIPELISNGKRSIKIWSAASSTGEEPYSIAILLKESGLLGKIRVDIFASDINTEVLETAKKGEYRTVSFRGVPPAIINKYFEKDGFIYKLSPEIKSMVTFFKANLVERMASSRVGTADVIFCRNVLIYFDIPAKQKVMEMFYSTLAPNGFLFLGHSETLNKITDKFKMLNFGGGIVYIKE
ncbi:protein-glutamate O-methyltransferase CheR [Deferribacterales bacterium Es71-Z0220]|jgi:chemotaxis protein methyltransferase CheR|uniref:CheR family methyltransferase n=1 Tax=Deferrivibrio essentukiensis TaxID=2880922 RepID=UPI001F609FFA|nr:protein-glutamate O-methyltransferase CheR [Deferrivibrio essentukiensis]MCB4204582.1 protein-glutamate O-methyltransferase CheR [Deferrivibrio essentukiensis]